ncbi:hypothetical protein KDM87_12105 [Undibacterium sp. FT147W]|uniref:Uncharacterized protein n=1 Tax=Undibacterium rivi TaxID=2828729 RepID=A0ABS5H3M3_9BURK|nr:hypothetical protein [Undibacterium rivi]MBR7793343.1 hypothetical protein [Undibacterium rivi]
MSSSATMQQAKTEAAQPAQRQQSKASAVQSELSDLRPQATAQRQLQDTANNSPQSHQLNTFQQMAQNSARSTQLKAMSAMMNAPAVQRVERTTSIYNRNLPSNVVYRKGMEIVDSTSPEAYVHISRNATGAEPTVNIQEQPAFFNGLNEGNKRSHINEAGVGAHVNLDQYTVANNGHITLEGRYAYVMSELANGFPDLGAIKTGAPVADDFTNLNFGSYAAHGNTQVSQRDIFTYISDYAEQAEEILNGREMDDELKGEAQTQITAVQTETNNFADHLISNSPLHEIGDDDFVHYGGAEWNPLFPVDFVNHPDGEPGN